MHGRPLLMVKENCIWSGQCQGRPKCFGKGQIIDRMGVKFPVVTDIRCRSYILNSHVLCLIDHLGQLERLGVSRFRLDLAGAEPSLVEGTVKNFKEAWRMGADRKRVAELRELLGTQWGLLTRGHWQRGV